MSKFIIALNEDVETLGSKQYDTLEEAKSVAAEILKELHSNIFKIPNGFEDKVSGYLDEYGAPFYTLTILEATPATLPNLGDMILNGLDDWRIDEGGLGDWLDDVTNKEIDELNNLATNWIKSKGYMPNWFNIGKSYLVSLEAEK
ncbi:hypothetical protein N654_0643 [Lactiplantibacillus plantarum 4_3]|nr:hypothetical protein [Lactiplantibacillus plantarum]ETF12895.1 hypothetical protein N654_0643 [Lactiplantibacillus plantarum 4_3]MCG0686379.1 hypothetical protein [Lactiplantibacillus plantarum]RCI88658.1 hypothetical protein DT256_15350 [Lactiplantibacillus plantarum]